MSHDDKAAEELPPASALASGLRDIDVAGELAQARQKVASHVLNPMGA